MRLVVNGEEREIANVRTVMDLLSAFRIENKILVVELNRTIVDREKYGETELHDGDRLEIVHFVGGG